MLAPAYDDFAKIFAAHGGTDFEYLHTHFARFVATRERLLRNRKFSRAARVLDVGAHWLHQAVLYALEGFAVSALDIPLVLDTDRARSLASSYAIQLLPNADLERPVALSSLPDDTFDAVLFTEVIEHLTFNPVAFWREIHRVLRPGGVIVLTTPNYYGIRRRLRAWAQSLRLRGGGVPVEQVLNRRSHTQHWKEYSRRELADYFRILSADFAPPRVFCTEEYVPAFLRRRLAQPLLWTERILPPLRPYLYAEIELARKAHGVTIEPRW